MHQQIKNFQRHLDFLIKKKKIFQKKKKLFTTQKSSKKLMSAKKQLQQENEKDQAIINDENAFPQDKDAAEARVEQRNEEIVRLQTQNQEREAAMPLRERVREIFKKYGVEVADIFLAAGAMFGAVVETITNALKKFREKMGDGLKTVGAKAASALPGLIGAIVSFIFKAAGSAIGFFAKHTWLLILAVVFLFEELRKRAELT